MAQTFDSITAKPADSPGNQQPSKPLAVGVWLALIVFSFWTSGPVFGWPALVLILDDEGIYTSLCDDRGLSCEARQSRLSLVFSAGFFCLLAGRLGWGLLLDRLGPRLTSFAAALVIAIGAALFGVSMHQELELYILAYALIGLGGPGIHLANFHSSNLFPPIKRTVTASFSGVFGTSGLVFVLFRAAYTSGLKPEIIWAGYAVLTALIALCYLIVQPTKAFVIGDGVAFGKCCTISVVKPNASEKTLQGSGNKLSIKGAVFHWKMLGLGIFFSVSFLHLQFYLGQAEAMLGRLGDKNHGNAFLMVFNIIGSSALVLFLPVGRLLDKSTFDVAFTLCNVLAIAFNVISLVDSLELQVVGFVCWCVSRMILFASFFSFIPAVVGFPRFGITSGALSTGSAIVGLLNIPFSKVALMQTHKPVMVGFLVTLTFLFAYPALLRWHAASETQKGAAEGQQESKKEEAQESAFEVQKENAKQQAEEFPSDNSATV